MSETTATKRCRGIETVLTRAGRSTGTAGSPVNPPVYRSSTFLFETIAAFEAAARQPFSGPFYGRLGTPTTFAFEEAMAELEGGHRSIATASGLAALTSTFMAFLGRGDHVLVVDTVYGPVRRFCDGILRRMGVEVTYYAPDLGAAIAAKIQPNTRLIHMEAPGSGTFEMQDVSSIATAARAHGVITSMDNTWATPLGFRPLAHGVDLSIHSATKYIIGHSDGLLGVVTTSEETYEAVRHCVRDLGCCAGSEESNLGLRGLRTLHPRLSQHQAHGLALAEWFAGRPEVARVLHPALPAGPGHELWMRDFDAASGLFAVEFKAMSEAAVRALVDGLGYFKLGFSWGGFESLVLPVRPDRTVAEPTFQGPILRFHAGLEDLADLIDDLESGLTCAAAVP